MALKHTNKVRFDAFLRRLRFSSCRCWSAGAMRQASRIAARSLDVSNEQRR
jgi:hypothetical protein